MLSDGWWRTALLDWDEDLYVEGANRSASNSRSPFDSPRVHSEFAQGSLSTALAALRFGRDDSANTPTHSYQFLIEPSGQTN